MICDNVSLRNFIMQFACSTDRGSDGESNFDTNNSLPYGLCAKEGIELPKGATPQDAWNSLNQKTGKSPEDYYAEVYQKGGSMQETTRFRTKGREMKVTYDVNLFRKTRRGRAKGGVLLKGEKIRGVECFAGKGSGQNLVVSGSLASQHPGTSSNEWMHKKGFCDMVKADGTIAYNTEVHWFEHEKVGQIKMKIKY